MTNKKLCNEEVVPWSRVKVKSWVFSQILWYRVILVHIHRSSVVKVSTLQDVNRLCLFSHPKHMPARVRMGLIEDGFLGVIYGDKLGQLYDCRAVLSF